MASLKNTTIDDTGFLTLPVGNTAARPGTPLNGMIRFNTGKIEVYSANNWTNVT